MTDAQHAFAALQAMTDAMARRDAVSFTSVYADDAVVWHNVTRAEQSKQENTAFLSETMRQFVAMEYRDIRRTATEHGAIQQHVLHATMADGHVLEVAACLMVTMEGVTVKRIDEYYSAP